MVLEGNLSPWQVAGGAAETPVQAEPGRKKHCCAYFRGFVLLLLTTLSKYIPLMDAAQEEAHPFSCERVPVPISLFPNTINWSYKRCYSSLPLLNNSVLWP